MPRRVCSILLLITWLTLGTGMLAYLHNLQHEWEDQANGQTEPHSHHHDENNCQLHAQLHAPMESLVVALPEAGDFALIKTLAACDQVIAPQAYANALFCRGPPTVL